jgi:hypothetical protein
MIVVTLFYVFYFDKNACYIFICECFTVVALTSLYGGSRMLQFGIATKSEFNSGIAQVS